VTVIGIALSTLLLALEILLFTNWLLMLVFMGVASLALLLHVAWRLELRQGLKSHD
jgi:hypothetical protein